ncbi:MAG: DUF1003 domain-containing protein [Novosphingobium sp.]|nr:DUF1003 domain-containing protein [Novosphingobium sp.]
MPEVPSPPHQGLSSKLRENIEALSERRRREVEHAPWSTRLSDRITAFTGSMNFVVIHVVIFGAWLAINLRVVSGIRPFDPTLVILAMVASVEAIFLSTFVLISQNRMMASADRRADLDLHISLLTEHELTRLATLVERIAHRLEVPVEEREFEEVKKDIEPIEVMEAIEEVQEQDQSSTL